VSWLSWMLLEQPAMLRVSPKLCWLFS